MLSPRARRRAREKAADERQDRVASFRDELDRIMQESKDLERKLAEKKRTDLMDGCASGMLYYDQVIGARSVSFKNGYTTDLSERERLHLAAAHLAGVLWERERAALEAK